VRYSRSRLRCSPHRQPERGDSQYEHHGTCVSVDRLSNEPHPHETLLHHPYRRLTYRREPVSRVMEDGRRLEARESKWSDISGEMMPSELRRTQIDGARPPRSIIHRHLITAAAPCVPSVADTQIPNLGSAWQRSEESAILVTVKIETLLSTHINR